MKHILNDLTEQEKNSIREQHTGGMKVMTESFSKLINSKLGDVKPILSEQDIIGMANQILSGSGDSKQKVKEFCDLCKKSKAVPHRRANAFADTIRDAVQGVGTDEEAIYYVFSVLKAQAEGEDSYFDEFCSLVKAYQQSYNVDLFTDLSSDISDESEWAKIMRPIRDLLAADSYEKTSSRDGGQSSNQTTSIPTRPTPPIPQPTGSNPRMNESFYKLLNSKLGDVKPMVNEQLNIGLASSRLAPQLQAADLSCIDASLFQTAGDGKKYHVVDKPSSIPGGVRERIVLSNDGTGYITQTGSKGKWKCGTSGVEFRLDSDPKMVRYLGIIKAAPVEKEKVNEPNATSNCAASLDEIKQGSNKILMFGCKTDAVKKLQEMLGMDVKYQTGYFGNMTKAKVIEFQNANKDAEGKPLVPDGKVGSKTYGVMVASKAPAQPTSNLRGVTSATQQYVPKGLSATLPKPK
jgi:hypothetical protein